MTHRGNGRTCRTETRGGIKIEYGIGLDSRRAERGVVTEDATSASGKSGGALSHHHVVKQKERQSSGVNPLCSQRGDDRGFHIWLPRSEERRVGKECRS